MKMSEPELASIKASSDAVRDVDAVICMCDFCCVCG